MQVRLPLASLWNWLRYSTIVITHVCWNAICSELRSHRPFPSLSTSPLLFMAAHQKRMFSWAFPRLKRPLRGTALNSIALFAEGSTNAARKPYFLIRALVGQNAAERWWTWSSERRNIHSAKYDSVKKMTNALSPFLIDSPQKPGTVRTLFRVRQRDDLPPTTIARNAHDLMLPWRSTSGRWRYSSFVGETAVAPGGWGTGQRHISLTLAVLAFQRLIRDHEDTFAPHVPFRLQPCGCFPSHAFRAIWIRRVGGDSQLLRTLPIA